LVVKTEKRFCSSSGSQPATSSLARLIMAVTWAETGRAMHTGDSGVCLCVPEPHAWLVCGITLLPEVLEMHLDRGHSTNTRLAGYLLLGGKPGYGQEAVFMELLQLLRCQTWEAGHLLYLCCCSSQSAGVLHQAVRAWHAVARLVCLLFAGQLPASAAAGPHELVAGKMCRMCG
jgi:hypothetical protein